MTNMIKYEDQQDKIKSYRDLATIAVKSGCYGSMTVEQAMNIMFSAYDLGISPHKALNRGLVIIKGAVTMSANLISDRIRRAGHSIKVTEYSREKCVCIGIRKDNGDSFKSEYDVEDAKLAGLLGKENWKNYPKDMLYSRAVSRLGRVLFADVVGACYSEDERDDINGVKAEKAHCIDPDYIEIPNERLPDNLEEALKGSYKVSEFEKLEGKVISDDIDATFLEEYLDDCARKRNKSIGEVIASALKPEVFPKFKTKYLEFINQKAPVEEPVSA